MKRMKGLIARSILFIAFISIPGLPSAAAPAVSITDDLGRKVELKQPARRIVTLAPFLTELV